MILVDTSFWVALRNRRENSHDLARAILASHPAEPLLTGNRVRGKTWTFLGRLAGHRSAVDFLDSIDRSPRLRLLLVSEDIETAALRWLRRHDEREYSFVDATSFALMRSLRIREALPLTATSRLPDFASFASDYRGRGRNSLSDNAITSEPR